MNKNQKKLKQFYKELAIWINAGMPEHKVFRKSHALCFQLCNWYWDLPWYQQISYDSSKIGLCQLELFGHAAFPFGSLAFVEERAAGNHYTNEARLNFIFEQAGVAREI